MIPNRPANASRVAKMPFTLSAVVSPVLFAASLLLRIAFTSLSESRNVGNNAAKTLSVTTAPITTLTRAKIFPVLTMALVSPRKEAFAFMNTTENLTVNNKNANATMPSRYLMPGPHKLISGRLMALHDIMKDMGTPDGSRLEKRQFYALMLRLFGVASSKGQRNYGHHAVKTGLFTRTPGYYVYQEEPVQPDPDVVNGERGRAPSPTKRAPAAFPEEARGLLALS